MHNTLINFQPHLSRIQGSFSHSAEGNRYQQGNMFMLISVCRKEHRPDHAAPYLLQ
jgi:hypothetical protein